MIDPADATLGDAGTDAHARRPFGVIAPAQPWSVLDLSIVVALWATAFIAHDWLYRSFPGSNDFYYHVAVYRSNIDAYLDLEVPHWNPYTSCGIPNLAVPINHAFSPTILLAYLINPDNFIHWQSLIWLALACPAVYALGRRYTLNRFGGLVAAAAYILCGPMQYYTEGGASHDLFVGICQLPVVLLAMERFTERWTAGRFSIAAIAIALMLLSAHFQAVYYNLSLLCLWAIFRLLMLRPWTKRGLVSAIKVGALIALPVVVAIVIASPDWGIKAYYSQFGMPLVRGATQERVTNALRDLTLTPSVPDLVHELFAGANLEYPIYYLGPASLILTAAAAAGRQRGWRFWLFAGLGLAALLTTSGLHSLAFAGAAEAAPGFAIFRKPCKVMYVVVFCFSMAGAMSMNSLLAYGRRQFAVGRFFILMMAAFAFVLTVMPLSSVVMQKIADIEGPAIWELSLKTTAGPRLLWVAGAAGAALVLAIVLPRLHPAARALLILAAVTVPPAVVDQAAAKTLLPQYRPSIAFSPSSPIAKTLAATGFEHRVLIAGFRGGGSNWRYAPATIPRGSHALYPYRGVNDFSNFKLADFCRFVNVANGHKPEHKWGAFWSPAPAMLFEYASPMVDYLGVKYIVTNKKLGAASEAGLREVMESPDGTILYENPDPLPYAYFVTAFRSEEDLASTLAALAQPRPAGEVRAFLTGGGEGEQPQTDWVEPVTTTIKDVAWRPGRVVVDLAPHDGGLLIVQEPLAEGWRARVDGSPAELQRANGLSLGVIVGPNAHRVELEFVTPGFRPLAMLSLAAIGACCVAPLIAVVRGRRRRKAGGATGESF